MAAHGEWVAPVVRPDAERPRGSPAAPRGRGCQARRLRVSALAVRGESLAAFDGRCILAGRVAPPSNTGRYSRLSRLAREAPRPSRCDARLSPRAATTD